MSTVPAPSLRDHIAAEEAELRPADAVTETPAAPVVEETLVAAVAETPEQEADGTKPDTDVSEAAKTLRRSRADERKARIQRDIDALKREEHETRDRIERLRREEAAVTRTPATVGAAPTGEKFRFPDYVAWAVGENEAKPYEAYLDERDDARDVWRDARARDTRTRETVHRTAVEREQKLEQHAEKARERYSDFDAVIDTVVESLKGNPRGADIGAFMAASDVGGEMAYRLGKDPALLESVATARTNVALNQALARLEAQLLTPAKASKPVTSAPAPPSKTVGGGASASTVDTTRPGTSLKDHIRTEEAELAERRKAGYRY
jgi:hypothetical protein